ncbi:sigma-54-dependent Fis family transcriptional regulator [Desulfosporosinus sp.]|uniref:sigma-54-dependent Fis family transcriptional regulator n=1 Tax=Desulfosporosinus sp. TaxID=157907 RepID=UPI000E7F9317|nr:sigma-54-dependent Fis family transcriptional regulator [Desulfosporosinus sp.]MBC2721970.1 sigma-54-dependent Fis family transcriptional regulator [Desulfosporosinus sp.]MBC2724986.1 sigma-54-dependent Fis family transcriptional regulator [Desulfosporosinus sp.]HBV86392.1 sigma-54-dependent Fis family transcriptional regulator [Desulfosporosinus sp.]
MDNQWKRFIKGESVESEVTPSIYRSWQRSLKYQVNHTLVSNQDILTTARLNERRDSQESLIRASEPVLPYIFSLLGNTNYTVLLGDNEGYIMEAVGDAPFMSKAQKVNLSPGASWREEIRGTNAIGTALRDNAPTSVFGWEHFVHDNHFLACWAAPIQDSQGFPLGVLDISGEAIPDRQKILNIAMMGASMIEKNLRLFELENQLKFYQEGSKLASSLLQQGFLTIDHNGIITNINAYGAGLLGRRQEDVIGQHAGEVFSTPKGWMLNGHSLNLHIKDRSGKEITSHLSQVVNESGQSLGAVGTLQISKEASLTNTLWVGNSQLSQRTLARASKIASTHSSVLIHGESGTGKEIISQTIHQLSSRSKGPFVALNCASLPTSLIESELFGYVEGAFTGARRGGKPGKFEQANKGTIFLDEIGDMPLNVQVALLRVLQEKEVSRIGDTKAVKIDVRVIAATHKDLNALVLAEKFRLDLYYRLKVVTLELPPLRERLEDIRDLVPFFIDKTCKSLELPPLGVHEDVYPYLLSHSWPGNVRELENCIESMVALAEGPILTIDDLPNEIIQSMRKNEASSEPLLNQQTKQAIIYALNQTKGKIAPAAKLLGIGRNTLYRKIKDLDIDF